MPPYFHHHVHHSTLRPMSCLDHCSRLTAGAPASTLWLATIYPTLLRPELPFKHQGLFMLLSSLKSFNFQHYLLDDISTVNLHARNFKTSLQPYLLPIVLSTPCYLYPNSKHPRWLLFSFSLLRLSFFFFFFLGDSKHIYLPKLTFLSHSSL